MRAPAVLAVLLLTAGAEKPAAPVVVPSPPANLRYTNDPSVCTSHTGIGGALICPSLLAPGTTLVLVWDWPHCGERDCRAVIDGFHVYQVSAGAVSGNVARLPTRKLVDTQSDAELTIKGIAPFAKSGCYAVTAFKGSAESAESNTFCMSPQLGMGTQTVTIASSLWQTRAAFNVACAHPNTSENATVSPSGGSGTTGRQSNSGSCPGDQLFEALFAFNFLPGQFKSPVAKAAFSAHVSDPLCLKQIGLLAAQDWVNANPHDPVRLLNVEPAGVLDLRVNGNTVSADVTALLNSGKFVHGNDTGQSVTSNGHPDPQGNTGTLWELVATGATAAFGTNLPSCESGISNAQLAITFYR